MQLCFRWMAVFVGVISLSGLSAFAGDLHLMAIKEGKKFNYPPIIAEMEGQPFEQEVVFIKYKGKNRDSVDKTTRVPFSAEKKSGWIETISSNDFITYDRSYFGAIADADPELQTLLPTLEVGKEFFIQEKEKKITLRAKPTEISRLKFQARMGKVVHILNKPIEELDGITIKKEADAIPVNTVKTGSIEWFSIPLHTDSPLVGKFVWFEGNVYKGRYLGSSHIEDVMPLILENNNGLLVVGDLKKAVELTADHSLVGKRVRFEGKAFQVKYVAPSQDAVLLAGQSEESASLESRMGNLSLDSERELQGVLISDLEVIE